MATRREFLTAATIGAAMAPSLFSAKTFAANAPHASTPPIPADLPVNPTQSGGRWRPNQRFGLGGVPISNGFGKVVTDKTAIDIMEAAWDAGVRLFDTSPFYTLGRGERRMGQVLSSKPRDEYVLSTKVGRILEPDASLGLRQVAIWADAPPFKHRYDYTADGTRRSIEDSLQRLGIARLDVVYVHDLGPGTPDLPGKDWRAQFEIARKGAFVALQKMKEEGIIKAWGLGVNEPEPIIEALKVAEPDVLLAATQYSLADHSKALDAMIPAVAASGASISVGAPLNGGFLAGAARFNYRPQIPPEMAQKYQKMRQIAQSHNVDLRTAALQFLNASPVVSSIIPGASHPDQVISNAKAFSIKIPSDFWAEMKHEGLIDPRAPVPG